MSHYFMDSSALIKRYVVETGTKWVRSLTSRTSGNTIIIAHITQAEIVSGAMRRKREGTITRIIACWWLPLMRGWRRTTPMHILRQSIRSMPRFRKGIELMLYGYREP